MSVLSRVSFSGNQRLDLSSLSGMDSFTAADFRALVTGFVGEANSYIVRGLEVTGRTGLTVNISVAGCLVYNPQDTNGSFYHGLTTDADQTVTLPASQNNVYVEATFGNTTGSPVNAGVWDPGATTPTQDAGSEFTTPIDFEDFITLNISVNTVGFSAGAIPLLKATTSSSAITSMTDCRELFFRLGTGGASPNPISKFGWATNRGEPVSSGTGVGNNTGSPWQSQDATGILNDKGITTLKQMLDAITTRISEITGSALWYQSGSSVAPATNVSLNEVFFDTLGHTILPSHNATFKWKESGGGYVLAGEGSPTGSSPYTSGLVTWQALYSNIQWQLGDTFSASNSRLYSSVRFTSPQVPAGSSLFLLLEREVAKGSGNDVAWSSNAVYPTYPSNQAVSGVTGDFTGIAIGDYIRKQSQGYTKYYQVSQFYNGTTSISTQGQVADSSITSLLLSTVIDAPSSEPLIYFRSRYASVDLYVGTPGQFTDANYYWLGSNNGNLFYLRGFGTLQDGEEVTIMDNTWSFGNTGGQASLLLDHASAAVYDSSSGYSLIGGATTTLLTIYRYVRDNTVESPTPGSDNSNAILAYTIAAPVGLITAGSSLWVRLSNSTGGALTNAPVTNTTDNNNNTDVNTNRWEIRTAANTPPKTFDDKDIFWVAKVVTQNGVPTLMFCDGSTLDSYGTYIPNNLSVAGSLKIDSTPTTSLLFVDPTTAGVVTSDTNLTYNKNTQTLGVGNFTVNSATIDAKTSTNSSLLPSLGSASLTIGGASSTVYIPGSLIVTGTTEGLLTQNLLVEDKLISLGVGDPANGGFGAGIEVADDTRTASSFASTNGSNIVTLTFGSSITSGYAVGNVIGVSATSDVGGITGGAIAGQYTIQSTIPTATGQARITSSTTLQVYANTTATSTASSTTTPPSIFRGRWAVNVSDSSGNNTGITSWAFTTKGSTTSPALTPTSGYGIVPTANSTTSVRTRVPYVSTDGQGPSGTDTTLDFSSAFTYDSSTGTLTVGSVSTASQEWQQLSSYPTPPTVGYITVFADVDGQAYYRTSDGNITNISEKNANVYDELLSVVASPSGNNQTAPISSPPATVTLPLDSKHHVGTAILASVVLSSPTVTVTKAAHGLSTGTLVTVTTSVAIGGISAGNLSVVNASITVTGANTFTYTAGASASATTSGFLDNVIAVATRYYAVGDSTLTVYLNEVLLTKGVEYSEVGGTGTPSTSISMLIKTYVGDTLKFRIDNNGGLVIYSAAGGGGTSLQGAYNTGNIINATTGSPIVVNPQTAGDNVATFNSDITVTGLIL